MADLIGQVTLLPPDLGGRRTPAYSGYCPDARLPSGPVSFTLRFMCYDALSPGESDAAMIEVAPADSLASIAIGDTYNLVEGTKVIGKVEILENLWKQRQSAASAPSPTPPPAPASLPAYKSLAPVLGVADVEESLAFFRQIGFEVSLDHRADGGKRVWAQLQRNELEIQLQQLPPGPIDPSHRAVRDTMSLFIVTEDIHALHALCAARNLSPSAPVTQFYGMIEFDLHSPDGWRILFAQFAR